jgi:putative solute:sodium symporter small subunit
VTTQNTDQDTQQDIEIENAARDRHQLRTQAVAITSVSVVLFAVAVAILYAVPLNRIWFLNFPLGFFLLAQGLTMFAVFVTFWYVRVQERIDLTRSMNEEIT